MTPERWQQVTGILHRAWACEPKDRPAFVERACGTDRELRSEVEALLASDERASQCFAGQEEPAAEPKALIDAALAVAMTDMPEQEFLAPGTRLGHYTITGLISKGGMGAVYRAVREDDFQMQVAVKLLQRGAGPNDALSRFREERQILAGLEHPNIARLLDGGTTKTGLTYLAMEYVDGVPFLEYATQLPLRRRLEIFRSVCSAVHYAHQHRVVHRDIKPGNILVTAEGIPKLLDFGIAKVLDPTSTVASRPRTGVHMRLMTPEYASPEQVRGEAITPATDIYSLGAVLHELLTGQPAQPIESYSQEAIERQVCTIEPAKPSDLVPSLDSDLDHIVSMALNKDPARRHGSAEDLSADIDRYLHDRPVRAGPQSRLHRARKFLKRNRVPVAAAALGALAVLSLVAGLRLLTGVGRGEARSLAVLPLENLSGDREQEYFADGLTDALINRLAQIQGLHVISRTSSMTFKGTRPTLPEVARRLGVQMIAEGSVLRSESRVRLSLRLVNASRDTPVWSGTFDGVASDLMGLQDQAAAAIAEEIGVTLGARHEARTLRSRRVDLAAYDAYLKGRHQYLAAFTGESVEKAITSFQHALSLDSGYAPAYAGLADCYYMLSNTYYPPTDMMPKAKWAAEKALQLDDTLGEAQATLALVLALYEFRRSDAEAGFRRAIELKPSNALAHLWYALHLAGMGRFERSISEVRLAARLDPVSPGMNAYTSWPLFFARRYDQAIQQLQPLADVHPTYNLAYSVLGEAFAQKGDWARAILNLEKAHEMDDLPESLAELGRAYAVAGRTADARDVLRRLEEISRRRYTSAYNFALVYAGMGDRENAFYWLQKVEQDRSEWFAFVNVDPRLDSLHSDPRFAGILRSVGLRK